jgi:hypothetical protein
MNMATTGTVQRDDAAECREKFEDWFHKVRRPQQDRNMDWPQPMVQAIADMHYASWQAAWKAARGET